MVRRRRLLSALGTGSLLSAGAGAVTGSGPSGQPASDHGGADAPRGDRADRVTFVEADPDAGFHHPYFLAMPAALRSGPVPLFVEMNNADEELSFAAEKRRARGQVESTGAQGAWLSEELGVPHLKPVFPEPGRDPVDATHQVALLDRETMQLEGTDLDRVDRQLLAMAAHARDTLLAEQSTDDQVLFYGNSSEGVVAERMAAMHPEHVQAAAAGGLNGFVVLPFDELGGHTLAYPVGVADLAALTGESYDADAHDTVDMFYFEGGEDPKNRLPMTDAHVGEGAQLWNDRSVYEAARIVYGADKVADRFPRCHVAFEKAGIDAQFRVYPEMTHDPGPAGEDVRDFFEASLAGESVADFGQRLELPLDRDPVVVGRTDRADGVDLAFDVSGRWPPVEGLVAYTWRVDGDATASGMQASHTVAGPGAYDVTLAMEAAHGQRRERERTVDVYDVTDVAWSPDRPYPGDAASVSATVRNPFDEPRTVTVGRRYLDGPEQSLTHARDVSLDAGETRTVSVEGVLERPGEHALDVAGVPAARTVTVRGDPSKSISFDTDVPEDPVAVGETLTVTVHVVFTDIRGQREFGFPLNVDGENETGHTFAEVTPYSTHTATFELSFEDPGEYQLTTRCCGDLYPDPVDLGTVVVEPESTPTATATPPPTRTRSTTEPPRTSETAATATGTDGERSPTSESGSTQPAGSASSAGEGSPGLGIGAAIAGLGSALGYLLSRRESDE